MDNQNKPNQENNAQRHPSEAQKKRRAYNRRLQAAKLAVIVLAVTALTTVCFLIPLRPTVSEAESRELAKFPKFSFSSLFSGEYFSGVSAWFSDTVPFRDTLTAVNGKLQHLLGTGTANSGFNEGVKGDDIPDIPERPATLPADTSSTAAPVTQTPGTEAPSTAPEPTVSEAPSATELPVTEAPTATEPPVSTQAPTTEPAPQEIQKLSSIMIYGNAAYEYYNFVQSTAEKYSATVNHAAARLAGKATIYDMIVPTGMDIMLPESVRASLSVSDQAKAIAYMEALLDPSVVKVDVFNELLAHNNEYIYFRTDHHWTGLGAYYAYVKYCQMRGIQPVALADCDHRTFDNFLGSFYADSGNNPAIGATPDTVEVFMPKVNADIRITESSGKQFTGSVIYDATTNSPRYKYSAFIWGDNPYSVIENHDMESGPACLLVKESYGNAIAPLLAYNYKYVYVMDYRYCADSMVSLVDRFGITDVLFCNNISMTRAEGQVNDLYNAIG